MWVDRHALEHETRDGIRKMARHCAVVMGIGVRHPDGGAFRGLALVRCC